MASSISVPEEKKPDSSLSQMQAKSLDYQYSGTLLCYLGKNGEVTGYLFNGIAGRGGGKEEFDFLPDNWQQALKQLFGTAGDHGYHDLARMDLPAERIETVNLNGGKVRFMISRFALPEGDANRLIVAIREITAISGCETLQDDVSETLEHEIRISKEKSMYISSVAHDFRTPLSIIYSNLQLLEAFRLELDEETMQDAFMLSKMAVKTLLRVLDKVEIIDASAKGKLEFKPVSCDLPALCRKVVDELNEMDLGPNRIELTVDESIGVVSMDETLFKNIFLNLLQNALNFSEKKQKVSFTVFQERPGFVVFKVADKGIGISAHDLDYIFEPFYRGSNSKYAKGSGLGLAVMKDCLKMHRGKVFVESSPGSGSVFTVELPSGKSE